jgi:hypothetical protein
LVRALAGVPGWRAFQGGGDSWHLRAEQLADQREVRGPALLMLVQVIDMALRSRALPLGLGPGIGQ